MNKQKKLSFMKTICWIGALADAVWAVALAYPQFYGLLVGVPDFNPDLQFRISMGIGASLMAGWTFLLIWASQNPVDRKGVFLITAFPVIFGLFITTAAGVIYGVTPLVSVAWIFVKLTILTALCISGYLLGRQLSQAG